MTSSVTNCSCHDIIVQGKGVIKDKIKVEDMGDVMEASASVHISGAKILYFFMYEIVYLCYLSDLPKFEC